MANIQTPDASPIRKPRPYVFRLYKKDFNMLMKLAASTAVNPLVRKKTCKRLLDIIEDLDAQRRGG